MPPPPAHLTLPLAVAVLLLGAAAGVIWHRANPPRGVGWLVAAVLVVMPAVLRAPVVFGTEGVFDMLAPGLLVTIVGLAVRRRAWMVAIAAAVVVGEELDWGQVLVFFPTPEVIGTLNSRSTALNFHNLRGLDVLWQPLPLLLLIGSAARPWLPPWLVTALTRCGVPPVVPALGPVLIGLGAFSQLLTGAAGARPMDEAFELASVWAFLVGWERDARPADR